MRGGRGGWRGGDRWGDIYAGASVKKMIALYDYDPMELSPNVDMEVSVRGITYLKPSKNCFRSNWIFKLGTLSWCLVRWTMTDSTWRSCEAREDLYQGKTTLVRGHLHHNLSTHFPATFWRRRRVSTRGPAWGARGGWSPGAGARGWWRLRWDRWGDQGCRDHGQVSHRMSQRSLLRQLHIYEKAKFN